MRITRSHASVDDLQYNAVEIDWEGYYVRFEQTHGEPVAYKGRLLFRDGWTYSSTDYAGPEWMPPEDKQELFRLRQAYWRIRREIVKTELYILETQQESLIAMQSVKSLPLVRKVYRIDSETGNRVVDRKEIDPEMFKGRLDWLRADLQECDAQLQELNNKENSP